MKKLNIGERSPKNKLRNTIFKLLFVTILVASCHIALAQVVSNEKSEFLDKKIQGYHLKSRIPDQYIVVFKDIEVNTKAATMVKSTFSMTQAKELVVREMAIDMATKGRGELVRTYSSAINGMVLNSSMTKSVSSLLNDPRVASIEVDQITQIDVNQITQAKTIQDNAPWGLDRIDQADLPLDNTYEYEADGTGVNVYVVDSGVRVTHQEFGDRALTVSYSQENGDMEDNSNCRGHGTHVAGIVGGTTFGVAKGVNIFSVQLGCIGLIEMSEIIDLLGTLSASLELPAVVNISLGWDASNAMDTAVNALVNAGATVVVAAGNGDLDACEYSPGRLTSVITVGATNSSDERYSISNYGSCLDIFAPGEVVTSAWNSSNTATNIKSGTSFAAPHVAGVAALYLEDNPEATPAQVQAAIEKYAIYGVVSDAQTGSPNLLLNTFREKVNTEKNLNWLPPIINYILF